MTDTEIITLEELKNRINNGTLKTSLKDRLNLEAESYEKRNGITGKRYNISIENGKWKVKELK